MKLTDNAKHILNQRYLLKNEKGDIIETPTQLFKRVAKAMAEIELKYGKSKQEVKQLEKDFYKMIFNFDFMPNSPTLMNAGTSLGQLSACFVLPIEDSIPDIFETIKNTAIIHKSGGGTGFSFSRLRPRDDMVGSTGGVSSGPISFMNAFNATTETIKQGGKRRGANMGIMRVDHPDILEFISAKENEGVLNNFNLSVAITDEFMNALINKCEYNLVNPHTNKVVKKQKASIVWDLLCYMSWRNGEPAVIFIDTINKANPTPELGQMEATNPCGELPLLPYESCNLGSINISNMLKKGNGIDWEKLRKQVRLGVRFLDNVIDANKFPLPQIKEMTQGNRKIGLGVMGWADTLLAMGIKYNSEKALTLGENIMRFIHDEGFKMSQELGKEKGNFPNKDRSIFKNEQYLRNATITTVAPTGTVSLIANCSSGIEPIFSVVTTRNVKDSMGKNFTEINSGVQRALEHKNLWTEAIEKAMKDTKCVECLVLPKELKASLVTAHDIAPEWHVKMQSVFQKYTDNSISKTVNLPNEATMEEIGNVYKMAYEYGLKGITVYRDKSREYQLLTKETKKSITPPESVNSYITGSEPST
jgi:ribonucleoside-diphosphate reductase alpha chain